MWKLQPNLVDRTAPERIYLNSITNSECKTHVIYTDSLGQRWWSFVDLFQIPIIREVAARKVTDLYTAQVTKQDIDEHLEKMKEILKSTDGERYEKAYAEVLSFEKIVNQVAN